MDPKQIVRDLLEDLPDDVSLHDIARKVTYVAATQEALPLKPFPNSRAKYDGYWSTRNGRRISAFVAILSAVISGVGFLQTPTPVFAWSELALALIFGSQALIGPIGPQLRQFASKRQIRISAVICLVSGLLLIATAFFGFSRHSWSGPVFAFALLLIGFGPFLVIHLLPHNNSDRPAPGA